MHLLRVYCVFCMIPVLFRAQYRSSFDFAVFQDAKANPYIETYLTFDAKRFTLNQNHIRLKIKTHIASVDTLIRFEYQVNHTKGHTSENFLDVQRYFVKPGNFQIKVWVSDSNKASGESDVFTDSVWINQATLYKLSQIEFLESHEKSPLKHPLQKFGVKLLPFSSSVFGIQKSQLKYYQELYFKQAADTSNFFIYRYFISDLYSGKTLDGLSGFKKIKGACIYPMLMQLPLQNVYSGRYVLTTQLVNSENTVIAQTQKPFIREAGEVLDNRLETKFFSRLNNADTLKLLLESLWPLAGESQKTQIINQSLRKDPKLMKQYIVQFWQNRCADTADPVISWAAHYTKLQSAMRLFKCGKQPAYYSDRGRVYMQYGPPNQRTQQANEENTYPYEIWQYYRLYDASNGQFFSNRKFIFVNQMLGDDCFKLIHSDMRGEINNPRWQFEITRRNNNGLYNPDNTTPAGTENNQFRDLYNNPR